MEQQTMQTEAPPDTKKMIRQLQETTVVASDMLEKLHIQGEQMDKISSMNEEHTATLDQAERLTKQLSFTGRISNLFRGKKKTRHHPQTSTEHAAQKNESQDKNDKKDKKDKNDKKKNKDEDPADGVWVDRSNEDPFKGHPPELTSEQLKMVEEQDKDLDEMSDILSSIREMSLVTQAELNSHTKKIDHMDNQIEKNLYSTQKTNAKLSRK